VSGNGISGVVGVNTLFQDPNGLNGFNESGIPIRTILINVATEDFFDPVLISRSLVARNITENFEIVGIDSAPDRSTRQNFGFNYFRISEQISGGGINPSNQRRAMVINGSTGELLANIQPGISNPVTENNILIEAINSVTELGDGDAANDVADAGVGSDPIDDFTAWAEAEISDPSLRGENDDPDADGIVNLLEYAYGSEPEVSDPERAPRIVTENGVRTLRYQRSSTALVSPIVILGGPSPAATTPFDTTDLEEVGEIVDEVEPVTVTLPSSLGARFFLRLTTNAL